MLVQVDQFKSWELLDDGVPLAHQRVHNNLSQSVFSLFPLQMLGLIVFSIDQGGDDVEPGRRCVGLDGLVDQLWMNLVKSHKGTFHTKNIVKRSARLLLFGLWLI